MPAAISDYFDNNTAGTNASISVWVKVSPSESSSAGNIIGDYAATNNAGFVIYFSNSSKTITARSSDNEPAGSGTSINTVTSAINFDQWYHVVAVKEGNVSQKIYLKLCHASRQNEK